MHCCSRKNHSVGFAFHFTHGCIQGAATDIWTTLSIPRSTRDSRVCLCAGDKPRSFVGSKQWVGAIELGFVLDTYLGITCRVITVPSGADMPSRAREIAHHFDTQVGPSRVPSCLSSQARLKT